MAVQDNVKKNDYERCQYKLILMDCNMPIMDGYESTKSIRTFLETQKIEQPYIAAVTGHTEQVYFERAI